MIGSEMDEIKKKILLAALKEYPQEFRSNRWVAIKVESGKGYKYSDAREDLENEGLIEIQNIAFGQFQARPTEQGKDLCDKKGWSQ